VARFGKLEQSSETSKNLTVTCLWVKINNPGLTENKGVLTN